MAMVTWKDQTASVGAPDPGTNHKELERITSHGRPQKVEKEYETSMANYSKTP